MSLCSFLCTVMLFFLGKQSIIQHGSSLWGTFFRNWHLQCSSSIGYRSCQETCSGVGTTRAAASLKVYPHAPAWASPQAATWISAPPFTSIANRGKSWVTGLFHWLQGNLCSGTWNSFSPCFFTELGVCRTIFLTFSHSCLSQLLCSAFYS